MPTTEPSPHVTLAHALPLPTAGAVAAALQEALNDLGWHRQALVTLTEEYAAAKARLQVAEDLALLGGTIDGKNETIREAQLRQATEDQRAEFQAVDLERVVTTLSVEQARDRLKTYRALAILLAGEDR